MVGASLITSTYLLLDWSVEQAIGRGKKKNSFLWDMKVIMLYICYVIIQWSYTTVTFSIKYSCLRQKRQKTLVLKNRIQVLNAQKNKLNKISKLATVWFTAYCLHLIFSSNQITLLYTYYIIFPYFLIIATINIVFKIVDVMHHYTLYTCLNFSRWEYLSTQA